MAKTIIKVGRLRRVFPQDTRLLSAWIARFSVLYEDIRLEVNGMYEQALSEKTKIDFPVQQVYFLRRAIATLVEIAEVLRLIDREPAFVRLKADFDEMTLEYWTGAIDFFNENERLLERVRNDVGGHFGSAAALFANR